MSRSHPAPPDSQRETEQTSVATQLPVVVRAVLALDHFIEHRFVGSRAAWILSRPFAALGWFLAAGSGPYE